MSFDLVASIKKLLGCKEAALENDLDLCLGREQSYFARLKAADAMFYNLQKSEQEKLTKISSLEDAVTDLQAELAENNIRYADTIRNKNETIESLKTSLAMQGEIVTICPEWLDETKSAYKPWIQIGGTSEGYSMQNPRHIYTQSSYLNDSLNVYENRKLSKYEKLMKAWYFVIDAGTYQADNPDNWLPHIVSLLRKKFDCIANYEEIYTKDGIKQVANLKLGDEVLSYDFDSKLFCYKPIVNIWEKGILKTKRVHFRNGQYIDITEDHPLWIRVTQKESRYEKIALKDVDLGRWWKRKVQTAKNIPYQEVDIPELKEELCFVIGHFLAEGSINGSNVETSGYDIIEEIIPVLEREGIPFSERINNSGVPIINFLKSWFKELLFEFKGVASMSFSGHIPQKYLNLPKNKLQKILDGYYLGDGTKNCGKNQYNKEYVLSTSSEQLAKDLQVIALRLGFSFHTWKQEDHKGVGRHPIWRLTYNSKSHFLTDYGYNDISEVSISYIEDLEETEFRDFEVAHTHTFVFRNGIISHQCEDGTIIFVDSCRALGIPANEIFNSVGPTNFGYHSYPVVWLSQDDVKGTKLEGKGDAWYIFETTLDYHPDAPLKLQGSKYWVDNMANWKYAGQVKKEFKVIFNGLMTNAGEDAKVYDSKKKRNAINKYWKGIK